MKRTIRKVTTATIAVFGLILTLGLVVGPAASGSRPNPVNCQLWLQHADGQDSVSPQWIDADGTSMSAADAATVDLYADANNEALSAQFTVNGVDYPVENVASPSTDPNCVHTFTPQDDAAPVEFGPGTHVVQVTLWSGANGTGAGTIDRYIVQVEPHVLSLPNSIPGQPQIIPEVELDCTPFCISLWG